jgi:hypothetical protein
MASTTLCFTGFSREETAEVQRQFDLANAEGRFGLAPEADAGVLVIDMDSMYGHMTWLKAHGSGKTTVGVTSGERAETDFLLRRPVDADAMHRLLRDLATGAPTPDATPATTPDATPATTPAAMPATPPAAATPASSPPLGAGAAPAAAQAEPAGRELRPARADGLAGADLPARAPAVPAAPAHHASEDYIAAYTTGQTAAMPANLAPHVAGLTDLLGRGKLAGPVRLARPGVPAIVLDPASQTWAGSATLKPLLPLLAGPVSATDVEPVDAGEFERAKAAAGGAQPYLRLLWLAGLDAGHGQLFAGYSAAKKFVLTKWPQIEREYPKHFRLATVMMKGPALVRELMDGSGVAEVDVVDFINAGLVTGAIVVEGSPASPPDVERAVALLARPRPA